MNKQEARFCDYMNREIEDNAPEEGPKTYFRVYLTHEERAEILTALRYLPDRPWSNTSAARAADMRWLRDLIALIRTAPEVVLDENGEEVPR